MGVGLGVASAALGPPLAMGARRKPAAFVAAPFSFRTHRIGPGAAGLVLLRRHGLRERCHSLLDGRQYCSNGSDF